MIRSGCARSAFASSSPGSPPPPHPPPPPITRFAAGRNFVRGGLLALMATFGGVLLFSTPEMLAKWASVKLPAALANPGTLVSGQVFGAKAGEAGAGSIRGAVGGRALDVPAAASNGASPW